MTAKRLSVRKVALYLFLGMVGAFAIWLVANLVSGSNSRIRIDESTTFITTPSTVDTSKVNYAEYVNQKLSEGTTVKNNAVAVLVKFVPDLGAPSSRSKYLHLLGIDRNEFQQAEFVSPQKPIEQIIEEQRQKLQESKDLNEESLDQSRNQLFGLMHTPWDAKQYPLLESWLKSQNASLDEISEAAGRARYFSPLVCEDSSGLISALLPVCQQTREFCQGLSLRAMQSLHQGNVEQCLSDLVAIRRLAKHLASGPLLVQKLIACSNFAIARKAELAVTQHPGVSAEELNSYLTEIQDLTLPSTSIQDALLYERLIILDAASKIAYFGADGLDQMMTLNRTSESSIAGRTLTNVAISMIDWNIVLQEINLYFDDIDEVLADPDLAGQYEKAVSLEEELKEKAADCYNQLNFTLAVLGGRSAKGKLAAKYFVASLAPAIAAICHARNMAITQEKIIRCLVGIAIYRKNNGRLPERLSEVNAISDDVKLDLFSGKEFEFRPSQYPDLYSFGPNQTDDQGHTRYSEPSGDDIPLAFD